MASAAACSTWTASSPRPRRSTTPRGRRCSTASCASDPSTPASRSSRSTRSRTTTTTSTANHVPTAPARSSSPVASTCPRATPVTHRRADRARPGQPQERDPATPDPCGRCRGLPRLGALCPGGPGRGPAPRGGVFQRELPDVLAAADIADLFEERRRRHRRRARAPAGQAGPGHLPGRRAGARAGAGRGRRLRRRAGRRGGRPGRRVRLRRSGSTASGRRTHCASTAPTSSWPTSPSCWSTRDQAAGVPRRTVAPAGDRAGPGHAGADGVGVRAVQRAHRLAGQPRRGRAARPAGQLPQRRLRAAAAALRRGSLRRATSPGRPSSTSPTAS